MRGTRVWSGRGVSSEPAQGSDEAALPIRRAFHRILKLIRAIADLENGDIIKDHHIAQAIQYRRRRLT